MEKLDFQIKAEIEKIDQISHLTTSLQSINANHAMKIDSLKSGKLHQIENNHLDLLSLIEVKIAGISKQMTFNVGILDNYRTQLEKEKDLLNELNSMRNKLFEKLAKFKKHRELIMLDLQREQNRKDEENLIEEGDALIAKRKKDWVDGYR